MRLRSLAGQQMQERIDAYVTEMDRTLHAMGEADSDLAGMGTTWTSIYVVGSNAIIVQIGDSRAYLLRKSDLKQITHDQTVAQALIDSGVPPEDTTRVRHILTNCLGGREKVASPSIGHLALQDGDRLLLCTDGLTDEVTDSEMAALLSRRSSPQDACDALLQLALDRGGKDNVTVIVAEFARARASSMA
jgi:serine/threonine protein phosphatase PrpC